MADENKNTEVQENTGCCGEQGSPIEHFFQIDKTGVLHLVFVGTEAKLQEQLDADYEEALKAIEKAIADYKEADEKLAFDATDAKDFAAAQKHYYYLSQIQQLKKELADFKKPYISDGTYFIVKKIGKDIQMEKK